MDPEDKLTAIFANFRTIARDHEPHQHDARFAARKALIELAGWLEKGGAPPKIMLDGTELKRYPADLR